MTMQTAPTRVGLLLIGSELLTGKIRDANGPWLIDALRARGVSLVEMRVVPDDNASMIDALRQMAPRVDALLTSGGVGPTHDDLTMAAVAQAFNVDLVEHPELRAGIDAYYADRPQLLDIWRRMARVPDGTELVRSESILWPVYLFRNIYILPGVPEIFRRQAGAILDRFHGVVRAMVAVYLNLSEGELAEALERVVKAHPSVDVGSYPVFGRNTPFRTRVTLEADRETDVHAAQRALCEAVGEASIVDVREGLAGLQEF